MRLNLRSSANLHSEDRKKRVNEHYDWNKSLICAFSVQLLVIAYAVHFSPANKINYQNICNSFCLNWKSEGGEIMTEQILAIKTQQNLNIVQVALCFSPGLVRLFVFIEGFGEVCKCQTCVVQQCSVPTM